MGASKRCYERWLFACDILADDEVPAAVTAKRLLKHMLRSWHVRCRGFSEDAELLRLRAENAELREHLRVLTAGIGEEEGKV